MNDGYYREALLASLDECAASIRDIESFARTGLTQNKQSGAMLLAILARCMEARGHVLGIVANADEAGAR